MGHVGGPQMPTLPATVQGSSSIRGAGAGLPPSLSTPQHPPDPTPRSQIFTIWKQQRQNTKTRRKKPLIPWNILDTFLLDINKINLCL